METLDRLKFEFKVNILVALKWLWRIVKEFHFSPNGSGKSRGNTNNGKSQLARQSQMSITMKMIRQMA